MTNTFQGRNFCFPLSVCTYVMGILNITPDSFYDGGKWNTVPSALHHAKEIEANGAAILDIGAQSTRPGHLPLSAAAELEIIRPYMEVLPQQLHIPISVDTFYPQVADFCLAHGACIINDVSGVFNPEMADVVQKYDAGWIVMHTGGGAADTPADYPNGVVSDVLAFFEEMQQKAAAHSIAANRLCLDMGIGFGKTQAESLTLLQEISVLKAHAPALMTALSNKRIISAYTQAQGQERLYGTLAANTLAIAGGTDFIRVHEVKEAVIAAKMADSICRK